MCDRTNLSSFQRIAQVAHMIATIASRNKDSANNPNETESAYSLSINHATTAS